MVVDWVRTDGPGECGLLGRTTLYAHPNPARGLAFREDQGPGARRLLVVSRCDQPGAGFQGRHTPSVTGSRGERSLLLVVVQRRSVWSGWVSGGAGTPPPERMKRRTFLWCDEARCRGSATAWGMQRGRAAVHLPRLRCTTPHILHVAVTACPAIFGTGLFRCPFWVTPGSADPVYPPFGWRCSGLA